MYVAEFILKFMATVTASYRFAGINMEVLRLLAGVISLSSD